MTSLRQVLKQEEVGKVAVSHFPMAGLARGACLNRRRRKGVNVSSKRSRIVSAISSAVRKSSSLSHLAPSTTYSLKYATTPPPKLTAPQVRKISNNAPRVTFGFCSGSFLDARTEPARKRVLKRIRELDHMGPSL